MDQKQIDEQAQGFIGFVAGGLILALTAAIRWPRATILMIASGVAIYFIAEVINSGYAQYTANARAEAKAQSVAQEEKEQAEFKMHQEGEALGFAVEGLYWRTVGALSDLEGMEIKGNERAKEFRAQYKLSAQDQPDPSWIRIKDAIEADIAAGDHGFTQTKARVALAEKKLEPAQRYANGVKANRAYFAGDGSLELSVAFIKEFGK